MRMSSGVLVSHPSGPPNARHAAKALHEAGLLSAYVTSFAYRPGTLLGKALEKSLGVVMTDPVTQLRRRQVQELPDELVKTHPLPQFVGMTARLPLSPELNYFIWKQTELWFDRLVARKYARRVKAVYGFEHAVLNTFERHKDAGGCCIYDMPIGHHKMAAEILEPEFDEFPEAHTPHDVLIRRFAPERNSRKDAELALADIVISPSSFVKDSLVHAGVSESLIKVIPFGAPPVVNGSASTTKRPFVFLSAGSQSVRKGTHYLLDAWRRLRPGKNVELWMVGRMSLPERALEQLPGTVIIRPAVPRERLYEIYRSASVLVLPTLCEGFALVITEAMAHGVPVITTENSGAVGYLKTGEDGFIVPIKDADRLAETMQWCLDHPDDLSEIARRALARVNEWQWADYRREMGRTISEFLSTRRN